MAQILSRFASRNLPSPSADRAGDVIVASYFIDLTAAQLTAGQIIDLGPLQANMTIADCTLIADDLDTNGTPLVTLDVGILSGTPGDAVSVRTMGAEIFSASPAAQTGVAQRASLATAFKIAATDYDRSIGVKINAAPATAAAGRIRMKVFMEPANKETPF
jgi:hypothetical protein